MCKNTWNIHLGDVMIVMPKRSPFGLIQEELWPNEWLILVSCIMLNCTSRKQVEAVLPTFIQRWPTPQALLAAKKDDVVIVCRSLGFVNRRTDNLLKMSERYVAAPWEHVKELPGIGQYGSRAWEIFCRGVLGIETPNDHALKIYWQWAKSIDGDVVLGEKVPHNVNVNKEPDVRNLVDVRSNAQELAFCVPRAAT